MRNGWFELAAEKEEDFKPKLDPDVGGAGVNRPSQPERNPHLSQSMGGWMFLRLIAEPSWSSRSLLESEAVLELSTYESDTQA